MHFAKRLSREADRLKCGAAWAYFDYKALKRAIRDDVARADAGGTCFHRVLVAELKKVSAFYGERVDHLETALRQVTGVSSSSGGNDSSSGGGGSMLVVCSGPGAQGSGSSASVGTLMQLRAEIKELIKYVALNYLAVVKAIKKRNRHLREAFGAAASTSLQPLDMLEHEVFFTSPRLAALATQAEVLFNELASTSQPATLEDYQCAICLDTMHNPVVLTCAHRFCWGCLVAYVTAAKDQTLQLHAQAASKDNPYTVNTLAVLEKIASADESEMQRRATAAFTCPVCRQPQVADVESLSVDLFLANYIEGLKAMSAASLSPASPQSLPSSAPSSSSSHASVPEPAQQQQRQQQQQPPPAPGRWGIIPPQAPPYAGRLCVLLDLDGTLVSSYTPRRAPRLPPYVRTHLVGLGSKLNPQGVFVVERPGLREFLEQLSAFAEVVIYTAGLEDYAKPIIDAIDPSGRLLAGRIYREGTLRTEYYQCVKDMARLNRDLARTVLVDDTPLAFLHQPDNGVPVLGFRGDPDDRLLLEAVLPLMHVLAAEPDVRSVLQRRFDMTTWFKRNSFPIDSIVEQAAEAARAEALAAINGGVAVPAHVTAVSAQGDSSASAAAAAEAVGHCAACQHGAGCASHAQQHQHQQAGSPTPSSGPCCGCGSVPAVFSGPRQAAPSRKFLLLSDFDKTLTDCDAGEALVEALAPELLPMLVGLEQPYNFIPITNQILGEIQRRGVSRDQLLTTLQALGSEMPAASCELLRMLHGAGIDVKVLSDCNSVFITHMLAGAKVAGYVQDIITNPASFERVCDVGGDAALARSAGHKLVIRPHHHTPAAAQQQQLQLQQQQQAAAAAGLSSSFGSAGSGSAPPSPSRLAAKEPQVPHGCPRCPDNLCKGLSVQRIQHANVYEHIVYLGDGANDICPALQLGPQDVLLARRGHALAKYVLESQGQGGHPAMPRVRAQVALWSSHDELLAAVRSVVDV